MSLTARVVDTPGLTSHRGALCIICFFVRELGFFDAGRTSRMQCSCGVYSENENDLEMP